MNVLLLQDSDEVRERLIFALESQYNANVIEAKGISRAIEALSHPQGSEHPAIDLIVFDYQGGQPADFPSLWAVGCKLPWVICKAKSGENPRLPPGATGTVSIIERATIIESLFDVVDRMVSSGELHKVGVDHGYCRIRTKLLLSVSPLRADIYIRLSEVKFLKLMQQGDVFDREDLEKYTTKKGVEYLFLKEEETTEFIEKYKDDLAKLLDSPKSYNPNNVVQVIERGHETVTELLAKVGFTKEVQELTKTQVQLMVKSAGRSPSLVELMKHFKAQEGKYLSNHSIQTSYLACAIASTMQWGSETTYYKLNLAGYFHDISLTNNEIAQYDSLADLEKDAAKFSPKEYREYKFHTVRSAELIKRMKELPPDVDTILMQHHEKPDGTGFPRGLDALHIAPLSAVFIIAHDLAEEMRKKGRAFSMGEYLSYAQHRFNQGNFKKVIRAMADKLNLPIAA